MSNLASSVPSLASPMSVLICAYSTSSAASFFPLNNTSPITSSSAGLEDCLSNIKEGFAFASASEFSSVKSPKTFAPSERVLNLSAPL